MPEIGIISAFHSRVDLVVEWKINDFFTLEERDAVSYISPFFSFGSERWRLGIFPNRWSAHDSSEYVDLRLICSSLRSIKQSFSVSLKTVNGEKYNEQRCTKDFDILNFFHRFNRYLPRLELSRRRSKLVPEGVLTVVCTMKNTTPAGIDSNCDSAEYCTFDSDSAEHSSDFDSAEYLSDSDSGECCHKCSDCLDIVKKQKLLEELESQKERSGGCVEAYTQTAEEMSCVEACTQTVDEKSGNDPERAYVEACTQTGEQPSGNDPERAYVEACTQTGEQPSGNDPERAYVEACTQTGEQPFSFNNPPEDCGFVTDINHLLKENRSIGVTFELETPNGKTKLFAHKLILAVMSSYFEDEFYDKERNEGPQVIPLKGVSPKAFEQMIRYCYGEKLSLRTIEDACALFKVASEFKVISLRNLCHMFFMHTKIEPGNVFSILKISVEMEDQSLQDMCYKILQEKTREIIEFYELHDVTPAMVYTLLNLPKLSLNSEYELINWIFDWAKVKTEDKNSSCRSARDYLAKLLRNMNFLALTVKEFVMLTSDNPKFFNSSEIASVSMNIVIPGTREMPVWHNKDLKGRVYTGSNE